MITINNESTGVQNPHCPILANSLQATRIWVEGIKVAIIYMQLSKTMTLYASALHNVH